MSEIEKNKAVEEITTEQMEETKKYEEILRRPEFRNDMIKLSRLQKKYMSQLMLTRAKAEEIYRKENEEK